MANLDWLRRLADKTRLGLAVRAWCRKQRLRRRLRHYWDWSPTDEHSQTFYRQFMSPGDLVFDVGANLGNRSRVFAKLEARIIAVEPQAWCADFLREAFVRYPALTVECMALGATRGRAPLHLSSEHTLSTLSSEWIAAVTRSGRFAWCSWDRTSWVEVDTLDSLIARHGCPTFIKLDVEGSEARVLAGLSVPVGALSFEFTPECRPDTEACIRRLEELGNPRFQIGLGELPRLSLPDWVDGEGLKKHLASVDSQAFGDVYVRYDV